MPEKYVGTSSGRIGPKSDKDLTNAEKIIFSLIAWKKSISTAESVTAGGFSEALTRVPGASRTYVGGLITYTRQTKKQLLNIPDEILDKGLVTPEITIEMAKRTREFFNTDYAVACTGNAGPTSDAGNASVGRVYFAIVSREGKEEAQSFDFFGNRDAVREKSITDGLRMVRNFMERE
jgi:PncC family amidohydrolase